MLFRTIAPLKLAYNSSEVGTGYCARYELSIDAKANQIYVEHKLDADDGKETRQFVLRLQEDWRVVIDLMKIHEAYAYFLGGGKLLPQQVIVDGIENHATDLIVYAWTEGPFLEIAQALTSASDEQLIALRNKVGSFRSRAFVQQMLSLYETAKEVRIPFNLLVRRARHRPIDLSAMQCDADVLAKIIRAEHEARRAHDEWNVAPFKNDIDHIVNSWRRTNLGNSSTMPIGVNAVAVKDYVVRWVTDHQVLPRDKHCIKYASGSREKINEIEFEVDFELLLARNQS